LAQFKGTPFDLAIARDADSNSLAGSVFTILTLQGWVRQAIAPGEIELFGHRGIFFAAFPSAGVRITAGSSGQLGACSVLFEMFTDSEISSMGLPGNDTATPIERQLPIQIMIGEKPKQSFKQVMQEALKACSMNEACRKANPAIMRSMPQ
jgi:hypothetical protein